MASDRIVIRGAREHNLKNVDLEIPRDRLVVITGLSGSGKSTLAFDTIYAEGQRRYVESLSAYARQFLEQMEKPDVDSIEGLSPAISIEQKTTSRNPRSTVGTVTEIYDYLRVLYARVGTPHCPQCGQVIAAQTVQQMVDRVRTLPAGTRVVVLAPVVRGRKGEYRKLLFDLRRQGFARVRVNGTVRDLPRRSSSTRTRSTPSRWSSTVWSSATPGARAPRRLPRDGPPARGGRGRRRGAGRRPGLGLLGAPGLRALRHLVPRGLAADVLLQQPVRRVPRVRRARDAARARPRPRRARPAEVAGQGGARALGRARVGLLPADAGRARAEAALQPGDALEGAVEGDPGADPPGHRRGRGLRRRARRSRAAVQGDHLRGHPARDRALHVRAAVPGLRRRSPPAREPGRPRRRARDPPGVRPHDQGRRRLLRRARPRRARAGDRPPRPQGDPRAARLPPERRARVPHARPRGRHALGRRGAADPPGDADRIEPGRRPLHPRRAVDRSPPAGQPPPPRHAAPAAGPRQHGPGRRARRGDDPGRRPRDRPRSRRRGAGRLRRRDRHARGDHGGPEVADRALPVARAVDPGSRRRAAPAPASS